MKIILALAMIIGMTLSAATTLGSNGTNAWTIAYTANTANTNNTDVVFGLTAAATATAGNGFYVTCVDTGVANFTLSAATTTGKVGFAIHLLVKANKTDIDTASITQTAFKLSVSYATSGAWTAGANNSAVSGGSYANTSSTVGAVTFTGLTATQLTALGLPNTTQTFYWQCYSGFNAAAQNFTSSSAITISTLGNGKTVKFGSGSYMGFFASGAIATTTAILALF